MDALALARDNHLFFYVSLTQGGLLTETFDELLARGASMARHSKKHPDRTFTDDIQQMPFKCNDGELGYLKFTNNDALLFEEKGIGTLQLAMKIPRSIQGELNDCCEVALSEGTNVSFKIVGYEGDIGDGCVGIRDPITECPAPIPLGRMVEMSIHTS